MAVLVCDVGPRDGLQNESRLLEAAVRAELCDRLAAAGLNRIEAASFVNPKLVPQMAGAEDVMAALHRKPGVSYAGLVLNDKGYERAVSAGVDEVHYAFAATDEFGRRNQNATTEEGLKTALALVARARSERVPITVTVSVAFGCPFEGPVPAERVLRIVEHLMEIPPDEICLADTIGVGVPSQVKELVSGARALGASVGAHFHNTRNTGMRTRWRRWTRVLFRSTRRWAARGAVRSRPRRRATSPPRTSSIYCAALGSTPGSTSMRSSGRRSGWRGGWERSCRGWWRGQGIFQARPDLSAQHVRHA